MDFKQHKTNNGNNINNGHVHINQHHHQHQSPQQQQHSVHNSNNNSMLHHINSSQQQQQQQHMEHELQQQHQQRLYSDVKSHNSPQPKSRLRRRCRSECLSPASSPHHQSAQMSHHERYNLRNHHLGSYKEDFLRNGGKYPSYYNNYQPQRNGFYSSASGGETHPSDMWKIHDRRDQIKENLMSDMRDVYLQDLDSYKKRLHKMQIDGVKSVQFERQPVRESRCYREERAKEDIEDYEYRSFYENEERRRRARSESESQDYFYRDEFNDVNGVKRTRDATSPPMIAKKFTTAKYSNTTATDTNTNNVIPSNHYVNNPCKLSSTTRHSVLVNNHTVNTYRCYSPKMKFRSSAAAPGTMSLRHKMARVASPLNNKARASLIARHKSLSPTMLKSNSGASLKSCLFSEDPGEDQEDSQTIPDEDCDTDDDDDDEPPMMYGPGDTVIDDDMTDPEDNYESSLSISGSEHSLVTSIHGAGSPTINTECVQGGFVETAPFAQSLFPFVPPYITFSTYEDKGPLIPEKIQKHLKWKLTTITPILVRKVLFNTGFRLMKNKCSDYLGVWGKHMKSPVFKTLHSYQKFNHLPGSFQIGRKDRCWRNLQTLMSKHGKKEFGFMPRTFIIPQDLNLLRQTWHKYSQKNTKWIIKPPASARGTGIKVVNSWSQIPKRKPLIVQRYIERPLLINGSKFDLRLYVLVTSINPLRIYMHSDGLARFASVKYSERNDTLNDRYMHLTNYSINKLSNNYDKNEDANACKGHKWTIKSLWAYLKAKGINTERLWGALRNLVLRTILAGEGQINGMVKANMQNKYNCFELFGVDVLLDSELVPWLLEVNISPSLHSASPLDMAVKGPLVTALLNTALYQIPPKIPLAQQTELLRELGLKAPLCYDKRIYVMGLSKEERLKHNQFTQKTMLREDYLSAILENLTPDDIRCLIIMEDELARCAPLERIFPAPQSHKYLQFTESPRYYNLLLDAWEQRYSKKRESGIALLRTLCWKRIHLKVPPTTIQKVRIDIPI
ncbi:unnamed protein product [Diamesa tonsa]